MAFYYGVSNNSVGTLFSSLSSSKNNGLSNLMSDYYSIRNGSYKKLLTAYYEKYGDSSDKKTKDSTVYRPNKNFMSNTISKDSSLKLNDIKSKSAELSESATDLFVSGRDSLFNKVEVKDEEGNVTKDFDKDKIYKAVNQFVKDYNNTIESTEDSSVSSIVNSRKSMVTTSKINSDLLESVGITINKDSTLSIDENKLKAAEMSTVKSLFNGVGSYGYSIATQASTMNAAAAFEATKTSTYTNRGFYSSSFSSGNMFDSIF